MIFPLNTPKKKKNSISLTLRLCYFPAEQKNTKGSMRNIDRVSSSWATKKSIDASSTGFSSPRRSARLRSPRPGTSGTSGTSGTTIWSPSGLNLRHYQNRPWDQATQAVNMVMGKPTINGSFTGKISYKWWFVNLSDGKKFDFLQTCLHRSAKVCHQQFLWISDPWEQDPASEPYPRRPIWAPLSVLGCPWEMWKHWIVLYRYYKLAMSQPA